MPPENRLYDLLLPLAANHHLSQFKHRANSTARNCQSMIGTPCGVGEAMNFLLAEVGHLQDFIWIHILRKTSCLATALVIAIGSTSCTTFGPAYAPHPGIQPDESLLYIFRPPAHAQGALTAVFTLDDVPVAKLENNGYVALVVKPGVHKLRHNWKGGLLGSSELDSRTIELNVTLTPGSTSYIRLDTENEFTKLNRRKYMISRWVIKNVPEIIAIEDLQFCHRGELIAPQR